MNSSFRWGAKWENAPGSRNRVKKSVSFINTHESGKWFPVKDRLLQENHVYWKTWLDEVGPVMTKNERAVFKELQTEDDRKRFQSLFWKVRDAIPGTPENEFMTEFYSRRRYAENRLEGAQSDRGRIYIILGKPAEVQNFSGSDKVVDCELWIYQAEGRSGLPPLMYLLFFKKDNLGEYKLYYPGLNATGDILSAGERQGRISKASAY